MAKTRLVQVICAFSMLAAAPAFAQGNAQPGDTTPGGTLDNPSTPRAVPAERMGSADESRMHSRMGHHSARHSEMSRSTGSMHGKNTSSENEAVERLNEQSYQAARSGQSYSGGGQSDMSSPGGSGSMHDMSGGSGSMHDMPGGSMSKTGSGSSGGGSK